MYINLSNLSMVKCWTNRTSRIDLYFYLDHCVVKKGGLSQKVLTAMQFSINGKKCGKLKRLLTSVKENTCWISICANSSFIKKSAGVMCSWLKNSHQNKISKKVFIALKKREKKKRLDPNLPRAAPRRLLRELKSWIKSFWSQKTS